jgi:hypothetical protein
MGECWQDTGTGTLKDGMGSEASSLVSARRVKKAYDIYGGQRQQRQQPTAKAVCPLYVRNRLLSLAPSGGTAL